MLENKLRKFVLSATTKKKLGIKNGSVRISPLQGGLWNLNYLVSAGSNKFGVKIYSEYRIKSVFESVPETEWKIMQFLHPRNLSAKPILFEDYNQIIKRPILMYEFIPGKLPVFSDEMLVKIAHKIYEIHQIIPNRQLHFIEKKDYSMNSLKKEIDYRISLLQKLMPNDEYFRKLQEIYAAVKPSVDIPYAESLIHTDLNPGNIIQTADEPGVNFIDWQYPKIGDPSYDVWSFASDSYQKWACRGGLSEYQKNLFYSAYREKTEDKTLLERINAKAPYYCILLGLHYLRRQFLIERLSETKKLIGSQANKFYRVKKGIKNSIAELKKIV